MQTYTDCRCVSDTAGNSSWAAMTSSSYDVTARPGFCVPPCSKVLVFAVILFVICLIRSLGNVPSTIINFRYAYIGVFVVR